MLNNEAQAAVITKLIDTVSAANTAAGTSAFTAVGAGSVGDLEVIVQVGAITGSFTPSFEDATSSGGAGNAAILPNEALAALTANTVTKYTFRASSVRSHLKFIGTIVTGPTLLAVSMQARPKYTA